MTTHQIPELRRAGPECQARMRRLSLRLRHLPCLTMCMLTEATVLASVRLTLLLPLRPVELLACQQVQRPRRQPLRQRLRAEANSTH